MNESVLRLCAILTVVLGFATQATASLQFNDTNYVGLINDGAPASEAAEVGYINILTTLATGQTTLQIPAGTGELYNRVGSTLLGPFGTAVEAGAFKDETGDNTINLGGTFQYILAKYDGQNDGSVVWYFPGGISGDIEVPTAGLLGKGLSHITAFVAEARVIPEPATLFVWGGLGAMALSIVRRREARG